MTTRKTIVGDIDPAVLAFTAGRDVELDMALAEADCIGSAAHVTMLSRLRIEPVLFDDAQRRRVIEELAAIIVDARAGRFVIRAEDQDIHLAVERRLTAKLGVLGKRIHTARSRNDQVAVDLRLFAKERLLGIIEEAARLAEALVAFGRKHRKLPMVGRTHLQPAMPSSVGLWATAHAEALLDDLIVLRAAYAFNDQCPLGSAAGYGVPLPIDRELTARLLGFARPIHNVLYASNARGKCESVILDALSQTMLSLSRLAEDLILYAMPEFRYFILPAPYCTGSSIMPQKKNPDVLELVRGRAARVIGHAVSALVVLKGLPGGYNRDLQEVKQPFMEGLDTTEGCLRILRLLVAGLQPDRRALLDGFTPAVFATDRALELVGEGMSFRDAYNEVRGSLDALANVDPVKAIALKTHAGGTAGLDFDGLRTACREARAEAVDRRRRFHRTVSRLLEIRYPISMDA